MNQCDVMAAATHHGELTSAIFLLIQAGATIWLQSKKMGPRIRLRGLTRTALWGIFLFELVMAGFVIWFVVLAPLKN